MARTPLLQLLADGEFHSGQRLAEALGVSRTAVWKRLNKLAAGAGLQIESVAYPGKCLSMPEDGGWVHVRPCYNYSNQRWVIQPNGHVVTGLDACLTVIGGANPATVVSTRFCSADPGQGWDAVP